MTSDTVNRKPAVEWPTLAVITACYLVWAAATHWADALSLWIAWPVIALSVTLHSSLQHEVIHGHPLPRQGLSDALVFPALGLFVPYERFRDQHLAHHHDSRLTDPYDDPESNYLDPNVWAGLSPPLRWLLQANNTLAGRMILGPGIGLFCCYSSDLHAIRAGDGRILRAYLLHLAGLVPVLAWLGLAGTVSAPAYLLAAYAGLGILKIRTYLEHRAHEQCPGRTVIIEDRGPLALLFLNNNLHAVHHGHPGLPWYRLPAFYRARRDRFLKMNRHYFYPSYWEIFRRHFRRAKDPVAHPLFDRHDA